MRKFLPLLIIPALMVFAGCTPDAATSPTAATQKMDAPAETNTKVDSTTTNGAKTDSASNTKSGTKAEIKVTTTTQEISMESGNLFFKPNSIKVKVNQPVKITFTNSGSHTFTIDELGVNVNLQDSTGIASFTPTKTGTFTFYCMTPGHKAGGMVGTITVTK